MPLLLESPMPETTAPADLPPEIVALLRDEATVSAALAVLEESRRDNLTRTEERESRRPLFGGLLSAKKDREKYQTALQTLQQQLAAIDALIARATVARDRLQPLLRIALVHHLSESDPAHRQGLRAARYHEHWLRCHAIVADRLKGFLRDLRAANTSLADDVKQARARFSGNTTWLLTQARAAAAELERSVGELNATCAEHAAAVAHTPFAASKLPKLEPWTCIVPIEALALRPPADAHADATRLLNEFSEIKHSALAGLEGLYQSVTGEHAQLAETSLRARWSILRAHAEAHWVSDAELEPSLAEIETRLLERERARLTSQFSNQAFFNEP
jgi:hypothetical protein